MTSTTTNSEFTQCDVQSQVDRTRFAFMTNSKNFGEIVADVAAVLGVGIQHISIAATGITTIIQGFKVNLKR